MCQHDHHAPRSGRAISLDHGAAHDHDHVAWTRRDFLSSLGLGMAGAAVYVGATPARAFAGSPLMGALAASETDRVLVIVQLAGGNDGLNTVVPITNDIYYQRRPTLALPSSSTHALSPDYGFHPSMGALHQSWNEGDLAVIQTVGYDDQDLSHFRSTDIWLSASDADQLITTGWAGRALAEFYPEFLTNPPDAPPAVQIGTSAPLLFQGPDAGYGMAMIDIDFFLNIVEGGDPYNTTNVPPTPAGAELAYLRGVANDAFRYRDAIAAASQGVTNGVTYPATYLGDTLAAVARLIKGRLDTRIYLVSLGGFDTHADQADWHAELLDNLSGSLTAFFDDLALSNDARRTVAFTFSEFGRRVEENGSLGTDHGAAAPLFGAGPSIRGGLYGGGPDLEDLDAAGNIRHSVDFRRVYATALRSWLGLDAATVAAILGGQFDELPIFDSEPVASEPPAPEVTLALGAPAPNPVSGTAQISYTLPTSTSARLDVYDVQGRLVARLADGAHAAGAHTASFEASALPAGVYLLRLEADGRTLTQRATVTR